MANYTLQLITRSGIDPFLKFFGNFIVCPLQFLLLIYFGIDYFQIFYIFLSLILQFMLSLSQFPFQLPAATTFDIAEIADQILSRRGHLYMLAIFLIFNLVSGLRLSRAVGANLSQYLTFAHGLIGS